MNIITEHKYQQARWSTADKFWDQGHILVSDVIERHNTSIIKLQGDHDAEMEKMRHQLADASQALTYSRQGKEAADAKIRRMSETIRRLSEKAKSLKTLAIDYRDYIGDVVPGCAASHEEKERLTAMTELLSKVEK